MALLAACVAAMAMIGIRFAGYGLPGWLDAAFGPRIEAHLGRFPVLVNWLPDVGTLEPVAAMTLALILACIMTPWGLVYGAIPVGIALVAWYWPRQPEPGTLHAEQP